MHDHPNGPSVAAACASLVVDEAITKLDALAAVSSVAGTAISRAGSARPFVPLEGGDWVEVEIPKFGEAPPLAIDVYSPQDLAHARASALALMDRLSAATSWRVEPMFPRD